MHRLSMKRLPLQDALVGEPAWSFVNLHEKEGASCASPDVSALNLGEFLRPGNRFLLADGEGDERVSGDQGCHEKSDMKGNGSRFGNIRFDRRLEKDAALPLWNVERNGLRFCFGGGRRFDGGGDLLGKWKECSGEGGQSCRCDGSCSCFGDGKRYAVLSIRLLRLGIDVVVFRDIRCRFGIVFGDIELGSLRASLLDVAIDDDPLCIDAFDDFGKGVA